MSFVLLLLSYDPFFIPNFMLFFIGPTSYKKDTIFAIEEEAELDNSDVDVESGKNKSAKMLRKKRKKRQDFRNKLEDWQQCSVNTFSLLFHILLFCMLHAVYQL